jgi:hypothetical protein
MIRSAASRVPQALNAPIRDRLSLPHNMGGRQTEVITKAEGGSNEVRILQRHRNADMQFCG